MSFWNLSFFNILKLLYSLQAYDKTRFQMFSEFKKLYFCVCENAQFVFLVYHLKAKNKLTKLSLLNATLGFKALTRQQTSRC